MRAEADTFSSTSSCVVVDVAPVEHRVLGRADVDEGRLHARQHVLDLAQVDVAVDLAGVVGGPGHVVLDERPALEHGDLGGLGPHVDGHHVAADGPALALPAPPPLERLLVELDRVLGLADAAGRSGDRSRPGPGRPASGGAWWPRPNRRRRHGHPGRLLGRRPRPAAGGRGRRLRSPPAPWPVAARDGCRRSWAWSAGGWTSLRPRGHRHRPAAAARPAGSRRPPLAGRVGQVGEPVAVGPGLRGRRRGGPAARPWTRPCGRRATAGRRAS